MRIWLSLLCWGWVYAGAWGGPVGLQPPTVDSYADVALYQLLDLRSSDAGVEPGWVEVTLGALHAADAADPGSLGLYQALVEIYIDDGAVGFAELLPGSGLRMADGRGWRDALRLTHEGAFGWSALRAGDAAAPTLVGMRGPQAAVASRSDRTLRVTLPQALTPNSRVYAISGVHDPFASSGWRSLASAPAPFAFASDAPGRPPIIDLYPGGEAAYLAAVERGVLGVRAAPSIRGWDLPGWFIHSWRWWTLMAAGMVLALVGVVLARRARAVERRLATTQQGRARLPRRRWS